MSICTEIIAVINASLHQIIEKRDKRVLKEDNSYVTEGDLLCETIVKECIAKNYPDYYLVSEESSDYENVYNSNQDKVIILDPIDGTENFTSGLKEWGVALCVYEHGKHVESMLALPELNSYLKTGDKFKKFESRICGISSSLTKEDILKLEPGFEYRIIGCAVYNMYSVITGSFRIFENPKGAKVWDIIPGLNLALEHGLLVIVNNKKYDGELLEPNQKYIFKIQNQ
jgi:fructose-1,6-bisphosphatase/inositol monophosphatase family enzyme